jgi:hypothetical protein
MRFLFPLQLSLNSNETEPIFPALVDCDKPLDSLIHVVYGGVWYIFIFN